MALIGNMEHIELRKSWVYNNRTSLLQKSKWLKSINPN